MENSTVFLETFFTHLIMETGAGVWTVHPAVTGQEGAAPAEGEAVGGVVTQELVRVSRHQGHCSALVTTGHETRHLLQVTDHAPGSQGPPESAVTEERVAREMIHIQHS